METIIKSFSEHGTFIQPDTLNYILSQKDPYKFTEFITKNLKEYPLVLTLNHIKEIEQINKKIKKEKNIDIEIKKKEIQTKMLSQIYEKQLKPQKEIELEDDNSHENEDQYNIKKESELLKIKKVKSWKPQAKEYQSDIKIIKDVTGNSICEGKTTDFNKLFKDRFNSVKKILKNQRRELKNTIPINRIKKTGLKEIQIVGIVKDVRTTKNGHRLIILEDETDEAVCIALKQNRDSHQISQETILDEIIGINGQLSKNGDLIVINNIVYPDISIKNEGHKTEFPVHAAFLSDIHVGSKQFMQEQWNSFLKWINGDMGNTRQRDVASKIKYIVIPGDVVDGIGIYPNQEKELAIVDVYRQYEALAEQLRQIPDHISIIMQPGNHDAVRPAEPQPTFEKEIRELFSDMNITYVGNPCYFSLNGVEILSYHGQSLLDYATNIQYLKYNEPVETMKLMLKKHHLAPTYGGYTPLAPENQDYMVIDKIPDIFVTGHVHLAQISDYRGVTLINASSWQEQTSYQKMLNFVPDSAKLPIVNLKTRNVTMMDFNNNK
jgi:DNA polymerase II small subunit